MTCRECNDEPLVRHDGCGREYVCPIHRTGYIRKRECVGCANEAALRAKLAAAERERDELGEQWERDDARVREMLGAIEKPSQERETSWQAVARVVRERDEARLALTKIDAIRNNIIGSQSVNWSRDIYPLVAALGEAGFEGEGYDVARARLLAERDAHAQHHDAELGLALAEARRMREERDEALHWEDVEDEWTAQIKAAHPTRSGSHDEYGVAMRMVGHRYSKGALVALVNWLLRERDNMREERDEARRQRDAARVTVNNLVALRIDDGALVADLVAAVAREAADLEHAVAMAEESSPVLPVVAVPVLRRAVYALRAAIARAEAEGKEGS